MKIYLFSYRQEGMYPNFFPISFLFISRAAYFPVDRFPVGIEEQPGVKEAFCEVWYPDNIKPTTFSRLMPVILSDPTCMLGFDITLLKNQCNSYQYTIW